MAARYLCGAILGGWVGLAAMGQAGELAVIGHLERVWLGEGEGHWLAARIDTGADHSSLGVAGMQYFQRAGVTWVRFSGPTEEFTWERPVKRMARIRRAGVPGEERPVVQLTLCLGGVSQPVEVNLARRERMGHPLLIGRSFLAGRFLIDASRQWLSPPTCP